MPDSRLVRVARSFAQWGLPLKLLMAAIIGIVGGGFLGYNAEYATYNYAIQYGFRVPIEGIPYLRAAVTFGSFFLLFSGSVVFFMVWLLLKSMFAPRIILQIALPEDILKKVPDSPRIWGWIKREIASLGQPTWAERVGGKTWPRAFVIAAILAAGLPYLSLAFLNSIADTPAPNDLRFTFISVLFPYIFALSIAVMRPNAIIGVASASTALYFVGALIFLWTPSSHAKLLRYLGYGGGLPVRIELADDRTTIPNDSKDTLYLMSRTTDAYILFDRQSDKFIELPRSSTRRLYTQANREWWNFGLPGNP